jgi:hypothetical protein
MSLNIKTLEVHNNLRNEAWICFDWHLSIIAITDDPRLCFTGGDSQTVLMFSIMTISLSFPLYLTNTTHELTTYQAYI